LCPLTCPCLSQSSSLPSQSSLSLHVPASSLAHICTSFYSCTSQSSSLIIVSCCFRYSSVYLSSSHACVHCRLLFMFHVCDTPRVQLNSCDYFWALYTPKIITLSMHKRTTKPLTTFSPLPP